LAQILIFVTAILSVIAFRFWLQLFQRRLKPVTPEMGLADLAVPDWPGLISLLLPRSIRGVWNALILGAAVLLLGTPHHLVIWNFWNQTRLGPWLYVHYVWTLGYWLALLAVPAMIAVRHRRSRLQTH
jgi:hypothetical protein